MTNIDTTGNIQIYGTEVENVTNYKYLGQAVAMENKTRIKAGLSVFGTCKEMFLNKYISMSLKRRYLSRMSYQQ